MKIKSEVGMKILVLGGRGFIGRSVVQALQISQCNVVIASRFAQADAIQISMQSMLNPQDWQQKLAGFDVVVNCIGILRARPNESFDVVHNQAVSALALACKALNIRLVHVSALGLSAKAKSGFITSKLAGEQAIINSGAEAVIVRPSLLDGAGGYGAKWLRRVARWPVHFVFKTDGLIAPLQVSDLGEAIAALCVMPKESLPKIAEIGGNNIITIAEYLAQLRLSYTLKEAIVITMPPIFVRLVSHICDFFSITPLSFGHFELMQGYNVPQTNSLPTLLGRKPLEVGEGAIQLACKPFKSSIICCECAEVFTSK